MNPKKEKPKLLYISNSPFRFYSGQGIVSKHLCKKFAEKYDVRIAGWGNSGKPFDFPCFNYPDSVNWIDALLDFSPQILFLSHDVWRFGQLPLVRKKFPDMKIVMYATIDGDPLPKQWIPILSACDIIFVPSSFGEKVIRERFYSKPVVFIPQGVDLKKLYFEGDKEKEKLKIDIQTLKYLQKKQIPQSKAFLHSNNFTVFFSGMNQSKKNIGVMLDGFCLFAEKHRDSKLILVVHSKMKEIFGMKVVSDYDITDLYSWRKHLDQIKIVDRRMSDEELLDIYKISDVLLSASIGEGFGLFALEAMATETVPILTDYSAFIELPDEEAMFRIPVSAYQRSEWNVKRAIVSQENVANQLEKAYNVWKNNPERWHELQQKNLKKVKKYSWKDCATAIEKYLDDLLEGAEIVDSKVKRL